MWNASGLSSFREHQKKRVAASVEERARTLGLEKIQPAIPKKRMPKRKLLSFDASVLAQSRWTIYPKTSAKAIRPLRFGVFRLQHSIGVMDNGIWQRSFD